MAAGLLRLHDSLHNGLGVLEPREDLLGAAVAFDQAEFECSVVPFLVDVGHGAHERTANDFRVVVEKVNL